MSDYFAMKRNVQTFQLVTLIAKINQLAVHQTNNATLKIISQLVQVFTLWRMVKRQNRQSYVNLGIQILKKVNVLKFQNLKKVQKNGMMLQKTQQIYVSMKTKKIIRMANVLKQETTKLSIVPTTLNSRVNYPL